MNNIRVSFLSLLRFAKDIERNQLSDQPNLKVVMTDLFHKFELNVILFCMFLQETLNLTRYFYILKANLSN